MKANPLNLCKICIHNSACVLTHVKNKVWSCSEFDESKPNMILENTNKKTGLFLEIA